MGRIGQLNTQAFARAIKLFGGVRPEKWLRLVGPCPRAHNSLRGGQDWLVEPTCPLCANTNLLYELTPLPTEDGPTGGKVLCYQATSRSRPEPQRLSAGSLQMNYLESEYAFAEDDRIILPRRYGDFYEKIERGTGSTDALRYPSATEVLSLFGPDGKITTGFALDADGANLVWQTGALDAGIGYTVRYRYQQIWMVDEGSIRHRPQTDDGEWFPSLAVLKLFQVSDTETKAGQL